MNAIIEKIKLRLKKMEEEIDDYYYYSGPPTLSEKQKEFVVQEIVFLKDLLDEFRKIQT